MSTTATTPSDLAQVLFASSLQPSSALTPEVVRQAIESCGCDAASCAAYVAQEAGDHPEAYASRMRWALQAVAMAYATGVPALNLAA